MRLSQERKRTEMRSFSYNYKSVSVNQRLKILRVGEEAIHKVAGPDGNGLMDYMTQKRRAEKRRETLEGVLFAAVGIPLLWLFLIGLSTLY